MSSTITSGAERWAHDAAATSIDLGYAPFPKQQQFHASAAKYASSEARQARENRKPC